MRKYHSLSLGDISGQTRNRITRNSITRNSRQSSTAECGSVLSALLIVLVLFAVVTVLVFYVFGQIVRSNQFGLRQNYFSIPGLLEKGFDNDGLLPGLHWKVPLLSTVHTLPRDFQFIHFDGEDQGGDLGRPDLEIPTTDGSKVFNDITLVVRFFEQPKQVGKATQEKKKKEKETALDVEPEAKEVPIVTYHDRSHGGPRDLVNTYTLNRERQLELLVTPDRRLPEKLAEHTFYHGLLQPLFSARQPLFGPQSRSTTCLPAWESNSGRR